MSHIAELLLAFGVLLFSSYSFSQTEIPGDDVSREGLKFAQIYGLLENNFADEIDPDQAILEGGVRGMLATLDPFSSFLNRDQFEMLQEQTRGKALGFGSILYVQTGKVVVLQTAQNSPSWRAGLGPGDEIVEVNGTRINRLDFQSLIDLLQRSRSHPVNLGVIRPGRVVPEDFKLNPAEVDLPTVDKAFLWAPGIAYLHLSSLEQKTAQEIADALDRLGGPSLKGALLDLRDNRGGLLDATVATASLFLKPDLLLLTARGRAVPGQSYRTQPTQTHFDMPLIILVNGNTASAAEILAAALEEHDRALVVGEPTFGKGVVESVMSLSEKCGLALTTAQYFTASGRSIQRPLPGTSLVPDVSADSRPRRANSPPPDETPARYTDNGRPVATGGGITPDVVIRGRALDPWAAFLNERGVITNFASEYFTLHGKVDRSFSPDSKVLDEFKDFIERRGIRVPEEYWTADQDYVKLRIKTELFNLVFGLAVGDEAETRGDPQVREAALLFSRLDALLRAPASSPDGSRATRAAKPRRE